MFGNPDTAHRYADWSDRRAGFQCTRILRWMTLLIVLPIGVATILATSMNTALGRDGIRDCGYAFARCTTFNYADSRRMTQIKGFRGRDGKLIERAGIVLDFSDGRRWSSADIGDFSSAVDPALTSILRERTGLPLNTAETESDIPSTRE